MQDIQCKETQVKKWKKCDGKAKNKAILAYQCDATKAVYEKTAEKVM